jgi:hypothetical protein
LNSGKKQHVSTGSEFGSKNDGSNQSQFESKRKIDQMEPNLKEKEDQTNGSEFTSK